MTQYKTTNQHERLGYEVCQGSDLKQLNDNQRSELRQALWQHGVIVARNQYMTAPELEQFAQHTFGSMIIGGHPKDQKQPAELRSEYVAILGNPSGPVAEPVGAVACQWHQDKDTLPLLEGQAMNALYVVMLHARKVPDKGRDGLPHTTHFLDLQEAWRVLDAQRQAELRHIELIHLPFRAAADAVGKKHPLLSRHKTTHREGLYMGFNDAIPVGLEHNPEKARSFWNGLLDEVLGKCTVYAHPWQEGDIVFWDNSQVMHCGQPYDSMSDQRVALRLGVIACDNPP